MWLSRMRFQSLARADLKEFDRSINGRTCQTWLISLFAKRRKECERWGKERKSEREKERCKYREIEGNVCVEINNSITFFKYIYSQQILTILFLKF